MIIRKYIELVCSCYSPKIRQGLQCGLESRFRNLHLNVRPDKLDDRDLVYQPGLVEIKPKLGIPGLFHTDSETNRALTRLRRKIIRRQGSDGSCTGQALAAVIDIQNLLRITGHHHSNLKQLLENQKAVFDDWFQNRVSARMLYEMARALDEDPEDRMPGSTLRNVIKGFRLNGVCSDKLAPYSDDDINWSLTLDQAKDAQTRSLGAYFRLNPVIYDYHSALNEVGAILVSAMIHDGWNFSRDDKNVAFSEQHYRTIRYQPDSTLRGGHAFVIIGYTAEGFLILNSWGSHWGRWEQDNPKAIKGTPGVALWTYEDWRSHVLDAWVFRIGINSEKTLQPHAGYGRFLDPATGKPRSRTPRFEVNGHYLHLKQGKFVRTGSLPNNEQSFVTTSDLLQKRLHSSLNGDRVYRDLVFIFNHGFQKLDNHVSTIASHIKILKQASVYPVFIYWTYGQIAHIENLIMASLSDAFSSVGSSTDISQRYIEKYLRDYSGYFFDKLMNALDENAGSRATSLKSKDIPDMYKALVPLLKLAKQYDKVRLHFVAHGDGALLMERFLYNVSRLEEKPIGKNILAEKCGSISLLAPIARRKDLKTTEDLMRQSSKTRNNNQINLVSLTKNNEANDCVGSYLGSYPRLAQQIYFPRFESYPEDQIIGLYQHALKMNRLHTYRHIPQTMNLGESHFSLINNNILVKKLLNIEVT